MLDSLRFVQGAVARKDFVQALTHYKISGGLVKGHNGRITLCSPIDLTLDVMPKATTFARAIATCKEVITISQTAGGRLSIRSGGFKALVDCVADGFVDSVPEGDTIQLGEGKLLQTIKTLRPFIAEDASRHWARGLLFRGQSVYATNNVVLLEAWMGWNFPVEINVPKDAIDEMIRIGEEPTSLQVTETSVTFHYNGGRWLKTTLYSTEWPDLAKVLGRSSAPQPPAVGLWDALNDVEPFVNKLRQVWFKEGMVTTDPNEDSGASAAVPTLTEGGVYNVDYLLELSEVITTVDWSGYPGPVIFYGENVRGAVIGMRG